MASTGATAAEELRGVFKEEPGALSKLWSALWDFVRKKPLGAFGGAVVVLLLFTAIFGAVIAPFRFDELDLLNRLEGPTWAHPFGTDNQGRDIMSRVIYGARTSVIISMGAVALAAVASTIIGTLAGYYGGKFDLVSQRFIDVWQAFPGLIFIIFVISILSTGMIPLILTMGFLFTAGSSRVVRAQAISVRQNAYIEAAQALGASDLRILLRHMLPNVFTVIIVNISIQVGAVILVESSLSFLGFGIPPPFPSWGRMLQQAQESMQFHPYLAFFPGLAIAITVYALNMFGDALRDVLDPRLRGTT